MRSSSLTQLEVYFYVYFLSCYSIRMIYDTVSYRYTMQQSDLNRTHKPSFRGLTEFESVTNFAHALYGNVL